MTLSPPTYYKLNCMIIKKIYISVEGNILLLRKFYIIAFSAVESTFYIQPSCAGNSSSFVLSHTAVFPSVVIFAIPDDKRIFPFALPYKRHTVALCDVNGVFKPLQLVG